MFCIFSYTCLLGFSVQVNKCYHSVLFFQEISVENSDLKISDPNTQFSYFLDKFSGLNLHIPSQRKANETFSCHIHINFLNFLGLFLSLSLHKPDILCFHHHWSSWYNEKRRFLSCPHVSITFLSVETQNYCPTGR